MVSQNILPEQFICEFHVEIADSEIRFISIHLGYLIEAACNTDDKVSVLLLCDSYHHIYGTL